MKKIDKLVVCGVGLIGGSFALALRRAGMVNRIVGVGRRPEPLEAALQLGVDKFKPRDGWIGHIAGAIRVFNEEVK